MSKIEHIMVPVDEWELADSIVKFADRLAQAFSARVSLLHVAPDFSRLPDTQQAAALAEQERLLAALKSRTTMGVSLRMGDPAAEIVKFALLEHVDLIAMPTHGRQGIDRLIKGSVTEEVLRHAPVPVLMSNEPERTAAGHSLEQIRRILMPVYTSESIGPIMPLLVSLARHLDSEVILYHDERGINDVGTMLEPQEAAKAIEQCSARLTREGVRHSTVRATSEPVATDILNRIREMNIDLVVMTTHGRSGLMRGVFGSVTESVLRNSPCPLLAAKCAPAA
jgi:nucleotide-binding universal stress UspA family protein